MSTGRLIAFGCSFTYGQGLPGYKIGDNYYNVSSQPSPLSWPFKLGEMLELPTINKGIPGASNLEILYQILNFDFEKNDVVVVMWSLPNRDMYFISDTKQIKPYRQLGLWLSKKSGIAAEWLRKLDPIDNTIKSWLYMHHADLYLKTQGVNYIHYPAFPNEILEHKPDFVGHIDNLYTHGLCMVDECNEDSHPGLLSQIETAKQLHNILKGKQL